MRCRARAKLGSCTSALLASDARAKWKYGRVLQQRVQGCHDLLVSKVKIMVGFFQVVLLAKDVYHVQWPDNFAAVLDALAFLKFDIVSLAPWACVVDYSFHGVLLACMLMAALLVVPVALAARMRTFSQRWTSVLGGSVVLTYTVYPSLSALLFQA